MPVSALAKDALRVLAWPGYADASLVKIFEQRYQTKVEVTFINSDDEMWARLSVNKGTDFDVFAVNTAELQRYIDSGVSAPLSLANIPNTTKQLPRFRNLAAIPGITRKGAVYAIPYTYATMGLIYDRKTFQTPPDSFSLMWDKRFKGRVLMYQGSTHNYSLAAMVLGQKDPFHIPDADFAAVSRHLVNLRRNVLAFYEQPEDATQLFMQNNIALLFANYGSQQVNQLKKAGADIGYVVPKEGALAWLDCWSLTSRTKNRKLAEAWIDYMLEEPASRALIERQGLSSTRVEPLAANKADKIIWLQQVESPVKRSLFWEKIISGDLPQKF